MNLTETLAYLHERVTRRPRVMLVLGSGLGPLADELEDAVRIPYAEIPGFAPVTAEGHKGVFVAGTLEGVECLALQGRYHLYEGHPPEAVTLPVRVGAALGARTLIVTNAAGGLDPTFRAGDLMIIQDHINLMWRNPLIGPALDGEARFPDMSEPYDGELRRIAEEVASERGIRVVRGVYAALAGPSYETPAEIRMLRRFGADAVGMSTVPEVLVARALGIRVLGISLITNLAAGLSAQPLSHEEVLQAGVAAAGRFASLVRGVLLRIGVLPDVEVV
ncbi:MAG: purine-nucleoside phosphorylase [Gemmatimonadota bacterium]